MKGWKTVLFNLALVVVPPALTYLASVDWTKLVNPTWAPVVVGVFGILLRGVTTTPIGKSS